MGVSWRRYPAQSRVTEGAMRKTIATEHVFAWVPESNFALCYLAMEQLAVLPRALFST